MIVGSQRRELLLTATAQICAVAQAVVQTKLLTTQLSIEQFGEWSLVLSLTALVAMLPFSALDQAVVRMTPGAATSQDARSFGSAVFVIYSSFCMLWATGWVLMANCCGLYPVRAAYLLPFLLFTFTEIFKATFLAMDNAERRRLRVAVLRAVDLAYRTSALLLVPILVTDLSLVGVLGIYSIGNLAIISSSWRKVFPGLLSTSLASVARQLRFMTRFSWPLLVWASFGWLQNMANRWYLAAALDPAAVAAYSVLVTISFFVPNFVYTIAANFVMPIAFRPDAGTISFRRHLRFLGILLAALSAYQVATVLLSDFLVQTLTSEKYLPIAHLIPVLTFTSTCYVVAAASTIELYRHNQTKRLLIGNLVPGIVSVVSGFLLVRAVGFYGAVASYALGQIIYAAMILTTTTSFVWKKDKEGRSA